jgi:hypothetical protein
MSIFLKILRIVSNILLLALLIAALVFVFRDFFSHLSFRDSSIVLQKEETFKLKPDQSLTQKFPANHDNIFKLELLFRAFAPDGGEIKVQLADENCQNILHEGALVSSFLASDNLYDFHFPSIPDSKDKNYCFKAAYTYAPPPGQEREKDDDIRFFAQKNKDSRFELMNATTGIEYDEGYSLSMRPVYKNDTWQQDLWELNQRMSQYKPWFLKKYYLAGITGLFLLLSVLIVILLIFISDPKIPELSQEESQQPELDQNEEEVPIPTAPPKIKRKLV